MDQGYSANEAINPRETASIFSIITFFYNYQILKKGSKKDLEEKDVYKVIPEFESERLGDKLESQWKKDKKENKRASISLCLIKCFGWTYILYGIVQLIFGTAVIFLQPFVFSKFVAYYQPGQTALTTRDAYLYGLAIIGFNLLNIVYNYNLSQLVIEYSMKVRTAVCSLIFRKSLKLSPVAFSEISIGKILTLMSKDVFSIDGSLAFLKDMVIGFLQLGVVTFILYQRVGISAFPAIGVILFVIPIQLFVGKKTTESRIKTAKMTDERFRLLQETLSAIKIIKMYTWQNYFEKLIHFARLKETDTIKIVYYLKAFIVSIGGSTINLAFYILLISYIARGHIIQAETVYFVQQCLAVLKLSVGLFIPFGIAQTADMIAALKRIQTFLDADEFKRGDTCKSPLTDPKIRLDKVKVTLKKKEILKSVSVNLDRGLLLVTGNVGSGKSSLLKAILGEYPISGGEIDVKGSFSYATEEPWLFPSTIRQNILFGQRYDEKRYQEVLNVCALTYDINKFEKLDETIVGDKGINLSKGQQARITLARAVYKNSDIYLLDDCLSSLDNHVNKHIFNECMKGFLKNKICVLVTNNINNIRSMNNHNVLFLENGSTLTLEQQRDALDKRITYYIDEESDNNFKRMSRFDDIPENSEIPNDDPQETDRLLQNSLREVSDEYRGNLYHEEKKKGKVLWNNYSRYYRFIGGAFVTFYLFVVFVAAQFCISYSDKLISMWVNLEPKITELTVNNQTNTTEYEKGVKTREQYLNLYTILMVVGLILFLLRSYSSFFFCMNGARKLHRAVVKAMLNAYMYFFDDHFIGNIINRLSKDFHVIDEYMPFLVFDTYRLFFNIIGVFALIASVNLIFFIPAGLLLIKLYIVQRFYLPTGRSLRRLEAATRSPIIGYINSALEGLPVARAAEQHDTLREEFDKHQDLYTSVYYMNQTTIRFFSFVLDILGVCFMMGIIAKFIIFSEGVQAGDVGLAISQAMTLSALLQYAVKQLTEIENVMTSVERALEYADVKTEPKTGEKLQFWPVNGRIRFIDVSLTYRSDGNTVLKHITFEIKESSKIGIVGRTGAGKTSIISTLFRLYDFDGQVLVDDDDINDVSLDTLRSKISIIPQDPVLFSGTIRTNIDPFNRYPDPDIWNALEMVHMKSLIQGLNQPIGDYASSFSSGQKQLICLARALVQNNKIIVLDEATANLDPETDQLLQRTVRECFRDRTVITIAHRLHSVMSCDKVLVLDAGRIVEFDRPSVLLENKRGFLYKMVKEDNFDAVG